MATTTNFGWVTPDNTDLVKDGASAIRTLGSSIDSSMGDLKGGTTGQVLSKTTGADMDFTWVTTDDTNAIQNAIVDAKGDLIGATAADTPARLAVGANNAFLIADSAEATGLKWANDWTTYTPTLTGGITVGNGTVTGKYIQIGKTVIANASFTFGSTSSMGSLFTFSYPVAPDTTQKLANAAAAARIEDSGTTSYPAQGMLTPDIGIIMYALDASGTYLKHSNITSTAPMTWATGDYVTCYFTYKAA
jgi:hypothetical protein